MGFTQKFYQAPLAFSFKDVILLPGFSKVEPNEIDISTNFSKNIPIKVPLVSSPMDTVTEEKMAIALALNGGMGIIHRNCSKEEELEMVKKVKEAEFSKEKYKNATIDENGKLRVGAAVSPFDLERAKLLSKYADALIIDVAHFYNKNVIEATKKISKEIDGVDLIIGNLGTKEGVLESITKIEKVDGVRVGIGGGSICITTKVTKAGAPTLFAVAQAADALKELGINIPIIADGGIKEPGDVALALLFGASCAMLGYVFAGCDESPSQRVFLNGKYYKLHRGMGSESAREKRIVNDRYASFSKQIVEGKEVLVPYRGSIDKVVEEFVSGIKASFGYAGASNIKELQENGKIARVRD
ncbi:MAG: guanosine monophosphate reductase [Candidatus Micrarchaeia archaeon]